MRGSMRNETNSSKDRNVRDDEVKAVRKIFVDMIHGGSRKCEALQATSVSRSTGTTVVRRLKIGNDSELAKALDSYNNRAGRRPFLSAVENNMIVETLNCAASRGVAIGVDKQKEMMRQVASDGRIGYANGLQSKGTILKWRSENHDIPMRHYRPKDQVKLAADCLPHVETYADVLKLVADYQPGIFDDRSLL